jgi:hypothetical protein
MARPASLKKGQWDQFERTLFASDLTAEEVLQITERPELLNVMLAAMREIGLCHLVRGYFTSIPKQIARVRKLNLDRGWGFTEEDFAAVVKSVPDWLNGDLVAVTLVPYLPDGNGLGGVERTFKELWQVAASLQRGSWCWDGYDQAGPDRLRLLEGIKHPAKDKPVLRWEVIDLGCNCNCKPIDIRNPASSPHAGILASAMLHPEWIKAMDGDEVPYVWAPGYEVNVSGGSPWQGVPYLGFDRDDREIELGCGWYGSYYSDWSVPSFIRE